jgi:hypothetical protein
MWSRSNPVGLVLVDHGRKTKLTLCQRIDMRRDEIVPNFDENDHRRRGRIENCAWLSVNFSLMVCIGDLTPTWTNCRRTLCVHHETDRILPCGDISGTARSDWAITSIGPLPAYRRAVFRIRIERHARPGVAAKTKLTTPRGAADARREFTVRTTQRCLDAGSDR